ncbi:hypothetical protein AVEN_117442-1 [Araneus ventricosus]|uniref:Uncharacterized protein n=1 Tax=Araneus ventricosus TaxID=182803 RepID=A0A4Y2X7F4_ARAVE|nr:hypothetical protein AVEN_117442-1 [Araneus ventricosus]
MDMGQTNKTERLPYTVPLHSNRTGLYGRKDKRIRQNAAFQRAAIAPETEPGWMDMGQTNRQTDTLSSQEFQKFDTDLQFWWKERFAEILNVAKPMNPDFGGKMKILENTRIMVLSLLETEICRSFWRISCDVTSYQKAIYAAKVLKQVDHFGVLFVVKVGQLLDADRY